MITILDVAKFLKVKTNADGSISAQAFYDLGLPFMGGCQHCEAVIAAYNAYPNKNGYLSCAECCSDNDGYLTAEQVVNDMNERIDENTVHYSENMNYEPDEYDQEAYEEELAYYEQENAYYECD